MRRRRMCSGLAMLLAGAACMAGGCIVAADLINPGVLGSLGLRVPSASVGTVVVRFTNDTNSVATLGATISGDPTNIEAISQIARADLQPNAGLSRVFDCPVGGIQVLGAGAIGADGAAVEVPFTGDALVEGDDFRCGDVISIRLVQTAAGFRLVVQVIPGR